MVTAGRPDGGSEGVQHGVRDLDVTMVPQHQAG